MIGSLTLFINFFLDRYAKDWIKNIVYGINYAFLIGLSWLIICTIYKRLISRKHVESYKNELIKEYTEKWAKMKNRYKLLKVQQNLVIRKAIIN